MKRARNALLFGACAALLCLATALSFEAPTIAEAEDPASQPATTALADGEVEPLATDVTVERTGQEFIAEQNNINLDFGEFALGTHETRTVTVIFKNQDPKGASYTFAKNNATLGSVWSLKPDGNITIPANGDGEDVGMARVEVTLNLSGNESAGTHSGGISYSPFYYPNGDGTRQPIPSIGFTVKINSSGITFNGPNPLQVTRPYGQRLSASNIKFSTSAGDLSLTQLSLTSKALDVYATDGIYDVTKDGTSSYTFDDTSIPKIQLVNQHVTPRLTFNRLTVPSGTKLGDIDFGSSGNFSLNATAQNPYNGNSTVTGTWTWVRSPETTLTNPHGNQTATQHYWVTFNATGTGAEYYDEATDDVIFDVTADPNAPNKSYPAISLVGPQNPTYTGSPLTFTPTVDQGAGAVTTTYYKVSAGGSKTRVSQIKDAGDYIVDVDVAENATHYAAEREFNVHVNPAMATFSFTTATRKQYGETYDFSSAQYKVSGLVDGTRLLSPTFTSVGTPSNAGVGSYKIEVASTGNPNYAGVCNGYLVVEKCAPRVTFDHDGMNAQRGTRLDALAVPNGSAVNPYTNHSVTGTYSWLNPSETVEGSNNDVKQYQVKFTPTGADATNYTTGTGTVSIQVTDRPTVPITIDQSSISQPYNGEPCRVLPKSDLKGAQISVTYSPDGKEQFSSNEPVDAGVYDFIVTAHATSGDYVDGKLRGELTINAASPILDIKVSGSGSRLSDYSLAGSSALGVKGQSVRGSVTWDDPSQTVVAGVAYPYTFHSSDSNYHDVHGTRVPMAASTTTGTDGGNAGTGGGPGSGSGSGTGGNASGGTGGGGADSGTPAQPAPEVEKEHLFTSMADALELSGTATSSSDGSNVPPNEYWVPFDIEDVLELAIEHASREYNDGTATQEHLDHAREVLRLAMECYEQSKEPGYLGSDGPKNPRPASGIELPQTTMSSKPSATPVRIPIGGDGDGAVFAISSNDQVAFVDIAASGSAGAQALADAAYEAHVTCLRQGSATITIVRCATESYKAAVQTLQVTVGEGAEDFDPSTVQPVSETTTLYRLYNPYSYEHLYTTSATERASLTASGWQDESADNPMTVLKNSSAPVYRLLNPYTKEHLYTMSTTERDSLQRSGWQLEAGGVAFYSDPSMGIEMTRLYNPAGTGHDAHHYSANAREIDVLLGAGYQRDGAPAWYCVK